MNRLVLLCCIAASLVASSCATSPRIPVRKTSDDCLVLIHTTIMADKDAFRARNYRLKLSDGYPVLQVPKDDNGFIAVRVSGPDTKIVRIESDVPSSAGYGSSESRPLDIDIPWEPGKVIVADFTFTQKFTKELNTNTTWSSWDIIDTSDADKKALLERYRKDKSPEANSWN
jgi:hypothetical protein